MATSLTTVHPVMFTQGTPKFDFVDPSKPKLLFCHCIQSDCIRAQQEQD